MLHVARVQQPRRLDDDNPAPLPLQWDLLAAADHVALDPRVDDALQDITVDTLQVCLLEMESTTYAQHAAPLHHCQINQWAVNFADQPRSCIQSSIAISAILWSPVAYQLKPAHVDDGGTGSGSDLSFEAVVVRRRCTSTPGPALLYLHGGPHSAYVASYISSVAYLAALGYIVIIVSPAEGTVCKNAFACCSLLLGMIVMAVELKHRDLSTSRDIAVMYFCSPTTEDPQVMARTASSRCRAGRAPTMSPTA